MQIVDDGYLIPECNKWAREKLDYLSRYLEAFSTALKSRFSHRCYVDVFAGAGKNKIKGTEDIVLGSPLIALNVKNPFTDCFLIEKDREKYAALKYRISKYNSNVKTFNEKDDLAIDKVTNIISKINNQVSVAFLDPYGFVKWSTIEKLASLDKMDLLIHFSQMGIRRNVENQYRNPSTNSMDLFFGDDRWRDLYRKNRNGNYLTELINLYMQNLCSLGYVYLGDRPTSPLIFSNKNAPLYRLIFASKNELGYKIWKSIAKRKPNGQLTLV